MWKKISFVAVLGLSLCPPAAMAAPFDGIVEGIAQQLAGQDVTVSSTYDKNGTQGGNVVIGTSSKEVRQSTTASGDVSVDLRGSTNTKQGLNIQTVAPGEFPVIMMQGADVSGNVQLNASNGSGSNQGVNLITYESGAGQ